MAMSLRSILLMLIRNLPCVCRLFTGDADWLDLIVPMHEQDGCYHYIAAIMETSMVDPFDYTPSRHAENIKAWHVSDNMTFVVIKSSWLLFRKNMIYSLSDQSLSFGAYLARQ